MKNFTAENKNNDLALVLAAQKGGENGRKALNELLLAGSKSREYWAKRNYEENKNFADNVSMEDYLQEAFVADREQILSYDLSKEAKLQTHRINGIKFSGRQLAKRDRLHCIRERSFSRINAERNSTDLENDPLNIEEVYHQDFRAKRLINNDELDKRNQMSKKLMASILADTERIKATIKGAVIKKQVDKVQSIYNHFCHGGTKSSFSRTYGGSRTTIYKSFKAIRENLSEENRERLLDFLAQ